MSTQLNKMYKMFKPRQTHKLSSNSAGYLTQNMQYFSIIQKYTNMKLYSSVQLLKHDTVVELYKLFHLEKHFYLQFRLKYLQQPLEWLS